MHGHRYRLAANHFPANSSLANSIVYGLVKRETAISLCLSALQWRVADDRTSMNGVAAWLGQLALSDQRTTFSLREAPCPGECVPIDDDAANGTGE